MTGLAIRPAAPGDEPALAGLFTELGYPSTPEEIGRRLPAVRADPRHCALVAAGAGGELVGCVHIGLVTSLESDGTAQILGLVVSAAHRREGIGRALVAAAEEWARRQGCRVVQVRTNLKRPVSPAFYAGIGYEHTKTQLSFQKTLPA